MTPMILSPSRIFLQSELLPAYGFTSGIKVQFPQASGYPEGRPRRVGNHVKAVEASIRCWQASQARISPLSES